MNPYDYQKLASKTECNQDIAQDRMFDNYPLSTRLNHAALGLMGEVGEFAYAIEKWIQYGQELDETNLVEEIGDCLWYLALACNALDANMEDVMKRNIAKLKKRFPDKFSEKEAKEENRDRQAEREIVAEVIRDVSPKKVCDAPELVCGVCCEGGSMRVAQDIEEIHEEHYARLCSQCGVKRIHKRNKSGVCPDCAADNRAKERVPNYIESYLKARGLTLGEFEEFCVSQK